MRSSAAVASLNINNNGVLDTPRQNRNSTPVDAEQSLFPSRKNCTAGKMMVGPVAAPGKSQGWIVPLDPDNFHEEELKND